MATNSSEGPAGHTSDGHIEVVNWDEYQHYKDRDPPWIKLYNSLIEDLDFMRLQPASRWLAVGLFLLASRTDNRIPLDDDFLRWRLKLPDRPDLSPLQDAGLIRVVQDDSAMLANSNLDATTEGETEGEGEQSTSAREDDETSGRSRAVKLPDGWEPNENHAEIASEEGVDLDREAEQFRDHAKANGRTQRDWDASFRNWLRKAADFGSGTGRVEEKKETSSLSDEEYERLYGVSG